MSKDLTSGQSLSSASDADWAEAVRREAVIRPLATVSRLKLHLITEASGKLGLSSRRIYGLLDGFRKNPVTASLLPRKSGPQKGARQLDAKVDAQIEAAIDDVYLKREQPTLRKVLREAARNCRTAGLTPPSMKALRARVSARGLRERMKAREGAEAAGDSFRLVKVGLRTERPLQVVQIDHTKVDIMLVDDVTRACIGRPWLTLVLDVHTRMVLGLYLSLDAPCATSAALAVARAVLPKTEWLADRAIELSWAVQGLPEIIHVDNGREFHSRAFERGCQQHGRPRSLAVRLRRRAPSLRTGFPSRRGRAAASGGLRLRIRRSKTEREGQGAEIGLPRGKHAETCPVRAFEAWQAVAKRRAGPLFRRISTGDRIGADAVAYGESWRTVSAGPGSPSTDLIV